MNELALNPKFSEVAAKLNKSVASVIGSKAVEGFEKAYIVADATEQLKVALTPEYLKPIMALQGNRIGFKTDKDSAGGYPADVVKNCIIEAVLMGVQPVGNQFNIIAGNCYITKEGFGYLLRNFPSLNYEIIHSLPKINAEKTSAAVDSKLRWKLGNGEWESAELPIAVKMNNFMGTDAVLGKADRKSRAWLYNRITGLEVADGDTQDIQVEIVGDARDALKNKSNAAMDFVASGKA